MLDGADQRILVLTPVGRDATLASAVLGKLGLDTTICTSIEALCAELASETGAVLMTEEALRPDSASCLVDALEAQPTWSDLPLVVLTSGGRSPEANPRVFGLL